MEDRKVTFSIQEEQEMLDRIDAQARTEGTSRSAIVRRALRLFFLRAVPEIENTPKEQVAA